MTRLARMVDRIGVRAPFPEFAFAQPKLPLEIADELRAAIIGGREEFYSSGLSA